MQPKLSILIATKNRIKYCINAIEAILRIKSEYFELVIQDNSDTYELRNYVEKIKDRRLIYNYTPPPFSSIDNFNAVIDLAKGKYVCLIGDDDGINPEIIDLVIWMEKNNLEAIVPGLNAVYRWPDTCRAVKQFEHMDGFLEISKITGEINSFDTRKELIHLLQNGCVDYLNYKLPKFYHGIVLKEKLDLIKKEVGFYIGGLSPDIYTAVALTKYLPIIHTIDYPVTIPGICILSTSADSATKTAIGKLEDAIHFRNREFYEWSNLIPRFYCPESISAESAIASIQNLNRTELLDIFEITSLTSILIKRHSGYKNIILESFYSNKEIKNLIIKKIWILIINLNSLLLKYRYLKYRLLSKIKRHNKIIDVNYMQVPNITNIDESMKKLIAVLESNKVSINEIIGNHKLNS